MGAVEQDRVRRGSGVLLGRPGAAEQLGRAAEHVVPRHRPCPARPSFHRNVRAAVVEHEPVDAFGMPRREPDCGRTTERGAEQGARFETEAVHELRELLDIGLQAIVGQLREPAAAPATRKVQADDPQRRRRVQGEEVEALGDVGQPADGDQGLSVAPRIGECERHGIGLSDPRFRILETHRMFVGEAVHRRPVAEGGGKSRDQGVVVVPVQRGRRRGTAPRVCLAQGDIGPLRRGQRRVRATGRRPHSGVR